ncbi:MAG: aminotransferase class V-fold PLP-dependent enzyme [Candidatus Margulisiibacteriota bacterium]|jgi:selenocysteine lyase/cysteine desulfurase
MSDVLINQLAKRYQLNPTCPQTRHSLRSFINGEPLRLHHLRFLALGANRRVATYDPITGKPWGKTQHIGLNYGATKPLLVPIAEMADYLETNFRENVGRSSGPHAEIMTEALGEARRAIGDFVGYERDRHVVIFTPNTSVGMNLLVKKAVQDEQAVFLLSPVSHHSSQLPQRTNERSIPFEFFQLLPNGTYDLDSIENLLHRFTKSGCYHPILCVESQSNVTGYKTPVEQLCWLAKKYRVKVFIDHAQGASSMKLDLKNLSGEVFIALSGHKLYARDGSGAIIGPKDFFRGAALDPAGGTISGVTSRDIHFADPPANFEPGTPAFIAQASLGKAVHLLTEAGLDNIAGFEAEMARRVIDSISRVKGLEILGESNIDLVPRGPVVSFIMRAANGDRIPPGFIGKALEVFFGVDARVGQFCAHPYVYSLLGVSEQEAIAHAMAHAKKSRAGCAALPGDQSAHAARISWGFPTPHEHLEKIPTMLEHIQRMWPHGILALDAEAGEFYIPDQSRPLTSGQFSIFSNGRYEKE